MKRSDFRRLMEKFKIHQQFEGPERDTDNEPKLKEDSREKVAAVMVEEERAGEAWRRRERGGQGRGEAKEESRGIRWEPSTMIPPSAIKV
mgnify:CR=1 FL=1